MPGFAATTPRRSAVAERSSPLLAAASPPASLNPPPTSASPTASIPLQPLLSLRSFLSSFFSSLSLLRLAPLSFPVLPLNSSALFAALPPLVPRGAQPPAPAPPSCPISRLIPLPESYSEPGGCYGPRANSTGSARSRSGRSAPLCPPGGSPAELGPGVDTPPAHSLTRWRLLPRVAGQLCPPPAASHIPIPAPAARRPRDGERAQRRAPPRRIMERPAPLRCAALRCAARRALRSPPRRAPAGGQRPPTAPPRHGTARLGTALHGTASHGTASHCTEQPGTARLGTAQPGTAQPGAARHGTARRGSGPFSVVGCIPGGGAPWAPGGRGSAGLLCTPGEGCPHGKGVRTHTRTYRAACAAWHVYTSISVDLHSRTHVWSQIYVPPVLPK